MAAIRLALKVGSESPKFILFAFLWKHTRKPLQIGIYAGLLLCYFFLVLSFLSNWLKHLFDQNKLSYAVVTWLLVAVQGIVLEVVAVALLRVIKSKTD
ncbi:MAG TPA: hypothetical protein VE689_11020 [Candidatus Udaeobacter sp.]|jgi:hypothetical protein|nr:hypothetical protein [Candidatus Udaeobacter sp.]